MVASASITGASKADVKFTAVGPAGLHIVGESEALQVRDDAKSLVVVAALDALATGIGLRDRHMKEKYLEVPKYPNATLSVDRAALRFPAAGGKVSGDAQGDLTLHGKTKRVPFHYDVRADAGGFEVDGTMKVTMTDFGIEAPSYMGMHVKPEVEVQVHFHAAGN
ncbi:MAG TPA: YceI family protein [Polyangiales bacterium]|nr:YceI family protein [Polyangiales bacterium]